MLEIDPPPGPGKYLVTGRVSFNPGTLDSTDRIRILIVPGTGTVDMAVLGSDNWPGGGVMSADIAFVATEEWILGRQHVIEWGGEKRSRTVPVDTSLPELAFKLGQEPEPGETTVPVGALVVKVRKHPDVYYYWYLVPIGAIIAVLIWRKIQMR